MVYADTVDSPTREIGASVEIRVCSLGLELRLVLGIGLVLGLAMVLGLAHFKKF